jgi:hypothetical protein
MSDPLLDLADAVVELINEHDWGDGAPQFTAVRQFLPILTLEREQPGTTRVSVVPYSDRVQGKACVRSADVLRIFVRQKLPAYVDDATDAGNVETMFNLVGSMRSFLLLTPAATGDAAAWCAEAERRPAFDMDLLHGKREFFAGIEGTWKSFAAAGSA